MSQAREVIQSLYDAFGRSDAGFVLGLMADDIHWMEAEGSPMASGNPYASPQQVGEGVFGRLLSVFDDFAAVPSEILAEGDRVVAFGRYSGVHKESGEKLDAPFVHSWTLDGETITAFQQYTDTEQHVRLMG
ncbi:nuclear transport factor 2 family protein [Gaopeijia maritima]|uniref:nuclear transport factor 2 family protein n=1 Tax=Gaopeijia maritima TaxID=3119007 RepID=UPI00324841A8